MVSKGHTAAQGPYRSEWAVLPPGARMSSGPKLLLKVMSGSMAQQHLGSMLMSVAGVTSTGDHRSHT